MPRKRDRSRLAVVILGLGFAIGLIPALTILALDPFDLFGWGPTDRRVVDRVEKRHGPLAKLIRYRADPRPVLILGDSRSRALREKLFHELGRREVFNFAYGGGTVPELVDAYWFAAAQGELDAIVIGAPLRMFDRRYKAGKNQTPEALAILDRPTAYLSSWLVFDVALSTIGLRAPDPGSALAWLGGGLIGRAKAQAVDGFGGYGQCRQACADAFSAPTTVAPVPRTTRPITEATSVRAAPPAAAPPYPKRWRRQIERAAASDWASFTYAEDYFEAIAAIVAHAQAQGTRVLFFIPPTPNEMQARLVDFGVLDHALAHRRRLAALAPVIDFGFPNAVTAQNELFTDAYHFGPVLAKRLVQEISLILAPEDGETRRLALKRRKDVACPSLEEARTAPLGEACLLWTDATLTAPEMAQR